MKKKLLTSVVLILIGTALAACNTVKGFGQDMQQGGQELQKAANDQQKHS